MSRRRYPEDKSERTEGLRPDDLIFACPRCAEDYAEYECVLCEAQVCRRCFDFKSDRCLQCLKKSEKL